MEMAAVVWKEVRNDTGKHGIVKMEVKQKNDLIRKFDKSHSQWGYYSGRESTINSGNCKEKNWVKQLHKKRTSKPKATIDTGTNGTPNDI